MCLAGSHIYLLQCQLARLEWEVPGTSCCPGSVIASQGLSCSALPIMAGTSQQGPSGGQSQEVLCSPLGQRTCPWLVSLASVWPELPHDKEAPLGISPWDTGRSTDQASCGRGCWASATCGELRRPLLPCPPRVWSFFLSFFWSFFQIPRGNKLTAVPVLKQHMFWKITKTEVLVFTECFSSNTLFYIFIISSLF